MPHHGAEWCAHLRAIMPRAFLVYSRQPRCHSHSTLHSKLTANADHAHVQLLFKRSHLSGALGVDSVEFLAATVHHGRLDSDERLQHAFRHFDTVDVGFISRADLVSALQHLGNKVCHCGACK